VRYGVGFASLTDEVADRRLDVHGTVPDWLRGRLVRTGPALFEIGGRRVHHWFDGLGMLHAFDFDAEGVTYSNRFLQSKAYRNARSKGRITHRDFATDPPRSYVRRITSPPTDNANVNVLQFDGTFVATTETVKMYEFRLRDLATYKAGGFGTTKGPWVSRGRHTRTSIRSRASGSAT
jgi:beta,beta-carotene 9',10'-dioxygenase